MIPVLLMGLLLVCVAHGQLHQGEECTHNNQRGLCKHLNDCPQAKDDIIGGKNHTMCTFNGFQSIVCCVQETKASPELPKLEQNPGAKAAKMCTEYGKALLKYISPSIHPEGTSPVKTDHCSWAIDTIIVSPNPAAEMEFPHMVQVGFGDENAIRWVCGGSLISPRFVLTAAHCVDTTFIDRARWVRIPTGTTDNAASERFTVVKGIRHPDYKPPVPYNDIGLLELEKDLELTADVRPACLHTAFDIPQERALGSGWNLPSGWDDDLMKMTLIIFPTELCNVTFNSYSLLTKGITEDSMLCVGSLNEGSKDCKSESGGPLQLLKHEPFCMFDIIGFTSFGVGGCISKNIPTVYTRVSKYVPWIESIVWP